VSFLLSVLIGIGFSFAFSVGGSASAFAKTASSPSLTPNKKWLQKELRKMKLSNQFVKLALESYDPKGFETVVKLNLLGFLQPPQHMDRLTPQSIQETLRFTQENQKVLEQARHKYQVPPTVISALLWIETRHGDDPGRFHILSVYLHLLQTDLLQNRKKITELAFAQNEKLNQYSKPKLKKLMAERTKKRTAWAREQILALAQIDRHRQLNLRTLKGSFAGAFGLPQFIPSSYREFAKSAKSKAPNLYHKGDAIMSVANYLSKHGWDNRSSAAKVSALMKYNNSRDYADSILEISKQAASRNLALKNRSLSAIENSAVENSEP
jgi:membrane-bound lytic murein transglycosylase B